MAPAKPTRRLDILDDSAVGASRPDSTMIAPVERMARLSVDLPAELRTAARRKALDEGTTIKDVVTNFLREWTTTE